MSWSYESSDGDYPTAIAAASSSTYSKKSGNSTMEEAPSPTVADKQLYIDNSKIPATPEPKPDGGPANSMAEAWEKEEMASINERDEAMKARIENWEIKRKQNAERKLERIKDKLDKRKAKAAESYYYERERATVENWDINKKRELDRKIEMIEEDLEQSRRKAEESYRNEIKVSEQIAAGAKAQAKEKRMNEILEVKEKAAKIRSTGKLPRKWLWF